MVFVCMLWYFAHRSATTTLLPYRSLQSVGEREFRKHSCDVTSCSGGPALYLCIGQLPLQVSVVCLFYISASPLLYWSPSLSLTSSAYWDDPFYRLTFDRWQRPVIKLSRCPKRPISWTTCPCTAFLGGALCHFYFIPSAQFASSRVRSPLCVWVMKS